MNIVRRKLLSRGSYNKNRRVYHFVPEKCDQFTEALCGKSPGRTSNGWGELVLNDYDLRACGKCLPIHLGIRERGVSDVNN